MKLGLGTYAYAWAIGIAGYAPAQPMDAFAFVRRAAALGVRVVQIADDPFDPLGKTSGTSRISNEHTKFRALGIEFTHEFTPDSSGRSSEHYHEISISLAD